MKKKRFKITGLYYQNKNFKFRKYLDIQNLLSCQEKPDLIAVMMNPGSSKPLDGVDDSKLPSEAIPDNTQSQIIKIMDRCGFSYARVLNLSDYREPKSNIFYNKIAEFDRLEIAHSIFDSRRIEDFNELWVSGVPVIFGWGVSEHLKPLAELAISRCQAESPYGLLKTNSTWAYYHPLPPVYIKQVDWIKNVLKQFNEH